jgi:hypothetical protein
LPAQSKFAATSVARFPNEALVSYQVLNIRSTGFFITNGKIQILDNLGWMLFQFGGS